MGHHFNGSDCSLNNLVWAPLDKISDDLTNREAEKSLKTCETFWIRKLCSMQPWGMNCFEVDTTQTQTQDKTKNNNKIEIFIKIIPRLY